MLSLSPFPARKSLPPSPKMLSGSSPPLMLSLPSVPKYVAIQITQYGCVGRSALHGATNTERLDCARPWHDEPRLHARASIRMLLTRVDSPSVLCQLRDMIRLTAKGVSG